MTYLIATIELKNTRRNLILLDRVKFTILLHELSDYKRLSSLVTNPKIPLSRCVMQMLKGIGI